MTGLSAADTRRSVTTPRLPSIYAALSVPTLYINVK